MTEKQVRHRLRKAVDQAGSQAEFCRQTGLQPSYVCDLLQGNRRPGPTVLKILGLKAKRTVEYEEA